MASGDLNQARGIPWICESQQTCGHIDFFPSKILSSLLATPVTLIEQDLAIQSVAERQCQHQKEDFWKYRLADLTPGLMNQSLHLNNILKQLKCT